MIFFLACFFRRMSSVLCTYVPSRTNKCCLTLGRKASYSFQWGTTTFQFYTTGFAIPIIIIFHIFPFSLEYIRIFPSSLPAASPFLTAFLVMVQYSSTCSDNTTTTTTQGRSSRKTERRRFCLAREPHLPGIVAMATQLQQAASKLRVEVLAS